MPGDFRRAPLTPMTDTLTSLMPSDADPRQHVWLALQRATQDRHHEWRTPVLASIGLDGVPQARTLVLRHVDPALWQLTFYTDSRSPKVLEFQKNPRVSAVFWSRRLGWQLRLQAAVTVRTHGPEVAAAWCRVKQSPSAGDYLSRAAPGSPLQQEADQPGSSEHHHLALLSLQVTSMDWLALAPSGHRRAVMTPSSLDWRVP